MATMKHDDDDDDAVSTLLSQQLTGYLTGLSQKTATRQS